MDLANLDTLRDRALKVITSVKPPTSLSNGDLFKISDMGMTIYDIDYNYASYDIIANFLPHHRTPYHRSTRGTVQITTPLGLKRNPLALFTCEVDFDEITTKTYEKLGVLNWYDLQLRAKVEAWGQFVEHTLMYGIASKNIPGLLNGSGIPIYAEPLDFSTATPQQMLTAAQRLCNSVALNSGQRYKPTQIGLPTKFFDLLNTTTLTTGSSKSVLTALRERLAEGFGTANDGAPREIISQPTFDDAKIMTITPMDGELLEACVVDLVMVDTPERASNNSLHAGTVGGMYAYHPQSSAIIKLRY